MEKHIISDLSIRDVFPGSMSFEEFTHWIHIQCLLFYRDNSRDVVLATIFAILNPKLQTLQDLASVISFTDASYTPWLRQVLPGYQKL